MARDRFPVVVHVLMLRSGATPGGAEELFLLRRAGTGFMDGYYVLPGGHQQAGESVAEAARRECREEAGVVPGVLTPRCVLPYRSGSHQGLNIVFEAADLPGEPVLAEPGSSDHAGWFPLKALPGPHAPWLADVLDLRDRGEWFRELFWA